MGKYTHIIIIAGLIIMLIGVITGKFFFLFLFLPLGFLFGKKDKGD